MKLRSGERREEQVGGGRIAEGAVEGRMARASPVAVDVAGAKTTAPCDRASRSLSLSLEAGGLEHQHRLGHGIFCCSLVGRRLLGRVI